MILSFILKSPLLLRPSNLDHLRSSHRLHLSQRSLVSVIKDKEVIADYSQYRPHHHIPRFIKLETARTFNTIFHILPTATLIILPHHILLLYYPKCTFHCLPLQPLNLYPQEPIFILIYLFLSHMLLIPYHLSPHTQNYLHSNHFLLIIPFHCH